LISVTIFGSIYSALASSRSSPPARRPRFGSNIR
jgi:hypothetical protein